MKRVESLSVLFALLILTFVCYPDAIFGQEILKQFDAPGPDARGLAWDGQYLWCADVFSGTVYQVDPTNGQVVSSFEFNIDYQFGGLAWSSDGHIWITDFRNQSWFFKVNPTTREVVSSFHCPGA